MGVSFVDQWRNNVGICRFRRGSIELFNLNAVTNIFFSYMHVITCVRSVGDVSCCV